MSKTEDYLDSLLNNVSPERKAEAERKRRRTSADFMKDFEDELNDEGMDDDIFGDLNEDEEIPGQMEGSFFDNLEGIVNTAKEASARESGGAEEAFEVNTLRDDAWTEQTENRTESKREKEEAASGDVQEILDVLSDLPSKEEISQASRDTGIVQEDEMDEESSEKRGNAPGRESKEEKKKEKKGLFQKLASLFSKGKKGDAEDGEESSEGDLSGLSGENQQSMQDLEDADQKSGSKKGKKDKKKPKKEKKKNEKKEKKEKEKKEKKPPKEKKPKKPKEVDLSPPLPKAPVILIFLMSLSILLLALICSNLVGYSDSISNAKKAYNNGDYVTAYQESSGLKIKEKDAEFQMRATILAVVQSGLLDGINLYNSGQYTMSLNSYICALGRYDTNYENAVLFEVQDKYAYLEEQIISQLGEKFGVSAETARELYALEDRTEYTCRVYDIVKNLGLSE